MRKRGRQQFVPEGAVVIYPHDLVHQMYGYSSESGTRKEMSRQGVIGVSGWPVEKVHELLGANERGELKNGVVIGDPSTYGGNGK